MPVEVADIETLRAYLVGVMDRADHHAKRVQDIALALAGAIVWRKDAGQPIEVMAHGEETKNVLWVYIGGQRYAFSYKHSPPRIEMREGTTQGPTLHTFDNSTPLSDLREVFESLIAE